MSEMKSSNPRDKINNNLTEEETQIIKLIKRVTQTIRKETKSEFYTGSTFYITGGWVRDKLLGFNSSDIDVIIKPKFYNSFVDSILNAFIQSPDFTVQSSRNFFINTPLKRDFEITKIEVLFKFTKLIEFDLVKMSKGGINEDYKTRDFSINSIYYDLEEQKIYDPATGLKSIQARKMFTCIPIKTTFRDVNRIIRLFRISAKIGFEIGEEILNYIKNGFDKSNLLKLKSSRLEFERLCKSSHQEVIIKNLIDCKILDYFPFNLFSEIYRIKQSDYERRLVILTSFMEKNGEILDGLGVKKLNKPTLMMLYWCFIYFSSAEKPIEFLKFNSQDLGKTVHKVIHVSFQGFFKVVLGHMLEIACSLEKPHFRQKKLKSIPEKIRVLMLEDPFFKCIHDKISSTLCNLVEFKEVDSTAIPTVKKTKIIDELEKEDVTKKLEFGSEKKEKEIPLKCQDVTKKLFDSISIEGSQVEIEFEGRSNLSQQSSPIKIQNPEKEVEEKDEIEVFETEKMEPEKPEKVEIEYEEMDLLGLDIDVGGEEVNSDLKFEPLILNSIDSFCTGNLDTSISNLVQIPSRRENKMRRKSKVVRLRQRVSEQKMLINHLRGRVKRLEKEESCEMRDFGFLSIVEKVKNLEKSQMLILIISVFLAYLIGVGGFFSFLVVE